MLTITDQELESLKDPAIKGLLLRMIEEINKPKFLPPCGEDPKQIAVIVNKITENL